MKVTVTNFHMLVVFVVNTKNLFSPFTIS